MAEMQSCSEVTLVNKNTAKTNLRAKFLGELSCAENV